MRNWSSIAFSTGTSGAIRQTIVDPLVNTGMVPPHPAVGADGNNPIQPDDYGPPPEDDVDMPNGGTRGNRMMIVIGASRRRTSVSTSSSSVDAGSCSASSTATTVFEP